ncbi:MAG: RidA family protein [Acidobacteria bacterium]|nr:RidA family protein [Acidobacteriota bacterium]
MQKTVIRTPSAPAAIGPYSQAVRTGSFLFLSGQIALDPATGQIVEGGIDAQVERVLKNIEAVLQAAGATTTDVVKTTLFLASMDDFSKVNEIYGRYFTDSPPARSTVEVSRLPRNVLFEMDAIAVLG